jgi:hypothetical protein
MKSIFSARVEMRGVLRLDEILSSLITAAKF